MTGNCHVRFLEGKGAARPLTHSIYWARSVLLHRSVLCSFRDFLAAADETRHATENGLFVPCGQGPGFAQTVEFDDIITAAGRRREGEVHGFFVGGNFDTLDLVEFLDSRLHLGGVGSPRRKAVRMIRATLMRPPRSKSLASPFSRTPGTSNPRSGTSTYKFWVGN
jgi:hypothetical protein